MKSPHYSQIHATDFFYLTEGFEKIIFSPKVTTDKVLVVSKKPFVSLKNLEKYLIDNESIYRHLEEIFIKSANLHRSNSLLKPTVTFLDKEYFYINKEQFSSLLKSSEEHRPE